MDGGHRVHHQLWHQVNSNLKNNHYQNEFDEWWFVNPYFISLNYRCNVGVSVVKMQGIPEFQWSPETIGFVDASFFWGYIVTQIPGGFLAARYLLF